MNSQIANLTLSEKWNLNSAEAISILQSKLYPYEWWILQCSELGSKETITFIFPLIAGLMNVLGVRVLWAVILSEWSNLILKWIFKGDRPYWWVQQHSYANTYAQNLRQFPSTCESGPGTPSGHLMLHVAISYVIVKGLLKYYIWGSRRYKLVKYLLTLVVYGVFDGWIIIVYISRLYIQAHFIHQCLFGIIMGLVIGNIAWNNKSIIRFRPFGSTVFANCLVGSALLIYGLLLNYGLDPLWAVPLAMKYCEKPEFVHIDTQPYYIMVRFSALALGLGFGVASKNRRIANAYSKSFLQIAFTVKAGIFLGKLLSYIQQNIPQEDLILYLSTNFVLQLLFPYMIVAMIPYFLHILYPSK